MLSTCPVMNKAAALERSRRHVTSACRHEGARLSSRAIALELTEKGVATLSGGRWYPQTLLPTLNRVAF